MHNWLQFLAVCHMLFSTAWETLLVPMFPNQLQTWKREPASNFTSLLLFRCSPLLTPQKLCRSPNEGMRRVKEICSHFDVKLIINAQLFYFICIGNIATLRLKRKKKKLAALVQLLLAGGCLATPERAVREEVAGVRLRSRPGSSEKRSRPGSSLNAKQAELPVIIGIQQHYFMYLTAHGDPRCSVWSVWDLSATGCVSPLQIHEDNLSF